MNNINYEIQRIKQAAINKANEDNEKLKAEYKKILLIILAILSELHLRLQVSNSISRRQKLKVLIEIEKQLTKYKKILEDSQKEIVSISLRDIYKNTYDKHYDVLNILKETTKDNRKFTEDAINIIIQERFHGKQLNKRIDDNTTIIFNKTYKTINDNLKNNKLLDNTVSDVNKIFSTSMVAIGLRLLMTEQSRMFDKAQNLVFKDFGIEYVQWCSALCRNTCEYCASMDGEIFAINDKPIIPAHSRCNCYWELV